MNSSGPQNGNEKRQRETATRNGNEKRQKPEKRVNGCVDVWVNKSLRFPLEDNCVGPSR
jgi:hypothetical protein